MPAQQLGMLVDFQHCLYFRPLLEIVMINPANSFRCGEQCKVSFPAKTVNYDKGQTDCGMRLPDGQQTVSNLIEPLLLNSRRVNATHCLGGERCGILADLVRETL